MGMCGVFIDRSKDVSISCNNDPNQDHMLLHISACVRLLCRPSFV